MAIRHANQTFASLDSTRAFAAALGGLLRPGDTVLLEGDIGAGKSFLARALIQSLQNVPEDVPSPTYTLVQTYDTRAGDLWHADLYRLTSTAEIEELGLTDAFVSAICVVEWPDRLGDLAPDTALRITLRSDASEEDTRHATFSWSHARWDALKDILTPETAR